MQTQSESRIKANSKRQIITLVIGIIIFATITIYYNILPDILILLLFIIASYSIGLFIKVNLNTTARLLVQISAGMGILGLLTHYILLAGFGSRTLYLFMLIIPILLQKNNLLSTVTEIKKLYQSTTGKASINFVFAYILIFMFLGNTTVHWPDALVKYLSVVTYAAENGGWKTNIVESIIYADQFSMYCSLATIGVALGANRFFIWISTLSMCLSLLLILEFIKKLYSEANIVLTTAIFFTIPLFLRLGTDMCIDFIQVVFLLAAILCMTELNTKIIWDNLQALCLLCSCAIFSKLTAAYIVLAIGIPIIVFFFIYIIHNKVTLSVIATKLLSSIFFLVGGLIIPIAYGFYYMGNPVAPWLNGIFQTPYVADGNFVDPFQNSALGLNLQSLLKVVFHTSANMETITDGATGIYLLGVLLFPIGIILYKKGAYIFWIILSFIMYKLATLFTYNLRYYIAIWVLFLALVCATLSIICTKLLKNIRLRKIIYTLLIIINVIPGIIVARNMQLTPLSLEAKKPVFEDEAAILLDEYVSDDSWVFGVGLTTRGTWKGILYSDTWYNNYLLSSMSRDNISFKDLLQGFDYVLYRKGQAIGYPELQEMINEANKENCLLQTYVEGQDVIIYEVKNNPQKVLALYSETKPMEITPATPMVYRWDDLSAESYRVSFDITNPNTDSVAIGYQLFYYTEAGELMDWERCFVPLITGEHHIDAKDIKGNNDAAYAIFSLYLFQSTETVYANNLYVHVDKDRSYLNNLVQQYYDRVELKNIN